MQGTTNNAETRDTQNLPTSSMLWVRNLKKYVGSGTGLGSEALMELETKRILLEAFKERQQKNAQSGLFLHFTKRLARFSFLKKQTEQLLNADDLDTMWVCLRENCVVDDSTGAEKVRA
ncbi:hypothetical protein L7F22_064493 [Adiantum nelumboides]|nr:hypothetical protein [Adiantum nelumboides]